MKKNVLLIVCIIVSMLSVNTFAQIKPIRNSDDIEHNKKEIERLYKQRGMELKLVEATMRSQQNNVSQTQSEIQDKQQQQANATDANEKSRLAKEIADLKAEKQKAEDELKELKKRRDDLKKELDRLQKQK